jgi:hypothetical protein
MSLVGKWMELSIIILSEISQTERFSHLQKLGEKKYMKVKGRLPKKRKEVRVREEERKREVNGISNMIKVYFICI